MDLKKMQNLSENYIAQFKKAATELVMNEVMNTDVENRKKIIMCTARDMAIGAAMKRGEYILTGVGIGVLGTALAFTVGCKIQNRDDDEDMNVGFDTETMEDVLKEDTIAYDEASATEDNVMDKEEELINEEKSIIDRVNEILRKPSNLDELKSIIKEIKDNDKK